MLLSVYLLYTCLVFLFMLLAVGIGTFSPTTQRVEEGILIEEKELKIIPITILLIMSGLLSYIVAVGSFNVEVLECANQVTTATVTGNVTAYTNQMSCTTAQKNFGVVAPVFDGIAWLDSALFFMYCLIAVGNGGFKLSKLFR